MTLHKISKIAKEGNRVFRKSWNRSWFNLQWPIDGPLSLEEAIADDWEIVRKKVKKTGWVNIYRPTSSAWIGYIYETKEEARSNFSESDRTYIDSIQIEWEEDE